VRFTIEVKVGKNLLSITEECDDTKDLFKKAGFYGTIPSKCGNEECGGDDLMLNHRQPQGKYDYYSVDCKTCGYRLNYGINNNDDETLFAKLNDGWEPPYQSDEDEDDAPKKSAKKKSGTSALAKAKAKKAALAAESEDEEEDEDAYENTAAEEKTASKPKRTSSSILDKYKKKKKTA